MDRQAGRRAGSSASGYLIAVIGLALAIVLGWAMMKIGEKKLRDASKIQAEAEGRLAIAISFMAREAMRYNQEASISLNRSNWGEAQMSLLRVDELVTLMEQVAPEARLQAVKEVRHRLSEAQRLTEEQSGHAPQAVNALAAQLDELRSARPARLRPAPSASGGLRQTNP